MLFWSQFVVPLGSKVVNMVRYMINYIYGQFLMNRYAVYYKFESMPHLFRNLFPTNLPVCSVALPLNLKSHRGRKM